VSKRIVGERSVTGVEALTGDERVMELALMTGSTGESNQKAAQEILQQANRRQQESY